jgi:hypothetical protein
MPHNRLKDIGLGDWSHGLLNVDFSLHQTKRATQNEPLPTSTFVGWPIAGSPPPKTDYVLFEPASQKIKINSLFSTCQNSQPLTHPFFFEWLEGIGLAQTETGLI